jgi:hypothetical protein
MALGRADRQRQVARAPRSGRRRARPYQGVNCARRPRLQTIVFLSALCAGPLSCGGEHGGAYDFQAARVPKDTMCVRSEDLINNYQIRRGCGWMCDTGASGYHEDCLPHRRGIGRSSSIRPVQLARLARPKGCFAAYDNRSIDERSGRITGRLGSTGLRDMSSEGLHSWHSGAHLPPLGSRRYQ